MQCDGLPARQAPCMQLVLAICKPKFTKFGDCRGPFAVKKAFSFVYSAFRYEDISAQLSREVVLKRGENKQFLGSSEGGNWHFQVWLASEHGKVWLTRVR